MADAASEIQLAGQGNPGSARQQEAVMEEHRDAGHHQAHHQYGHSQDMQYGGPQQQQQQYYQQQQHNNHQQYYNDHDDDNSIVYAPANHPQHLAHSDGQQQLLNGRALQQHNPHHNDEDEEDEDEDEVDDMDDDPDESSELELPEAEEDIDYDVVYALHTFLATVEGQASVVKGDQLTLLDDSNSYWWLVRVLKTQLVGYIPAENIETPEERLARFYKKQNLNQARARESDIAHGAASARRARAHFAQPHHPTNRMLQEAMRRPKMQLNPELPGGGRFVDFGPPTFQEFEGYPYTDEESDGSMEDDAGEGGDFDDEEEEGSDGSFEGGSFEDDEHAHARAHGHIQHQDAHSEAGFGARDSDREQHNMVDQTQRYYNQETQASANVTDGFDDSDAQALAGGYHQNQDLRTNASVLQPANRATQAKAQAALGVANGGRPAYFAQGQDVADQYASAQSSSRNPSVDERLRVEQERAHSIKARHAPESNDTYSGGSAISRERTPPGANLSNAASRLKAFTEQAGSSSPTASQESETRKISLTPRIAREDSTDSNLSEASGGAGSASTAHVQAQQHKASQRNLSNASSANADISNVSSTFTGGTHGRTTPTSLNEAEDRSHFRRGSAGSAASSVNSAFSNSSAQKRGGSPNDSSLASGNSSKKKKSGGILGGLFSRSKKDKKEDKDKKNGHRKNSESTSDEERGSSTSSPAPDSPEQEKGRSSPAGGVVTQQLQQRRAQQQAKEEMFGAEAARRQQQVEAQNVMYQAYGIHPRGPGDTTNASTFSATVTPPTDAAFAGASADQLPRRQGVAPGDMAISPSQSSLQSNISGGHTSTGRQLRPGSLIGSPHMANSGGSGEVPILNVLRVFAGDNIVADATFKTVLLNESTSTEELVKQALQRFRLDPPIPKNEGTSSMDAIMQEYYLTAKEMDGEETRFMPGQRPLKLFESLSQATGFLKPGQAFPSVKRSSVGSISSISSTLSMNPAIEKLRMSDFSDDSHVKLFINKRSPDSTVTSKRSSDSSSTGTITGRRISDDLHLDANRLSGMSIGDKMQSGQSTPPLTRFAVKIIIHPSDLPDSMAFDPFTNSLIAKSALQDRENQALRSPSMSSMSIPRDYREKVLFFPRNANVSEMLETALDRFGIVEGVVDGGDDVDSKILKRRSMSRIRYSLAMIRTSDLDQEMLLNPSSKVLDAYEELPAFKPYEKSSKEFRRRSMETPYNIPSSADLQASDPIFVIRKAKRPSAVSFNSSGLPRDESVSSITSTERSASRASESTSIYATPSGEIPPSLERAMSPQQAKQEIIAAQRAASRANQRAMLSAHKNEKEGVDVILADKSLIRSSRDGSNMRYSYVAADGASEVDISEIVENEWRSESRQSNHATSSAQTAARDSPSAMSHLTAESYTSALASPLTPSAHLPGHYNARPMDSEGDLDAEERMAIDRVASAPLSYDQPKDYLEQALGSLHGETNASQPSGSSKADDSIDQKLERVLSKVRKGAAIAGPAGIASALRNRQQQHSLSPGEIVSTSSQSPPPVESGRSTPVVSARAGSSTSPTDRGPAYVSQIMRARSGSAASHMSNGRASPGAQLLERISSTSARSTPQPEAPPSSGSSTPRRAPSKGHIKQPSLASIASDASSFRSGSPSTPATASASHNTSTPMSSTRNDSSTSHRFAIPYRDDFGLDFLMQLVALESGPWQSQQVAAPSVAAILTDESEFPQLTPALGNIYEPARKRLDELDERLDQLLLQATHAN